MKEKNLIGLYMILLNLGIRQFWGIVLLSLKIEKMKLEFQNANDWKNAIHLILLMIVLCIEWK